MGIGIGMDVSIDMGMCMDMRMCTCPSHPHQRHTHIKRRAARGSLRGSCGSGQARSDVELVVDDLEAALAMQAEELNPHPIL